MDGKIIWGIIFYDINNINIESVIKIGKNCVRR